MILSRDKNTLGMTSFGEYGVEVCDDEHGLFYYMLDEKTILIEQDLA